MSFTSFNSQVPRPGVVDGVGHLPIVGRDGLIAVALLDPEDLDRAVRFRWRQHANGGYVVRGVRRDGKVATKFLSREILRLPDEYAPRVFYNDGDPLNLRKSNLRVSPQVLARMLHRDPALRAVLTRVAFGQGAVA